MLLQSKDADSLVVSLFVIWIMHHCHCKALWATWLGAIEVSVVISSSNNSSSSSGSNGCSCLHRPRCNDKQAHDEGASKGQISIICCLALLIFVYCLICFSFGLFVVRWGSRYGS